MKIENISEGMRIANYRKLCELLGENVLGGNAKKAQLKKWEKHFGYRRENNAYIITEIYPIPKPADDGRMKYAQHIEPVLLNHLARFGTQELTFDRWYVALGMMSDTFLDNDKMDDIQHMYQLKDIERQKLLYTLKAVCQRNLLSTLRILEKNLSITYSTNEYIVINSARRLATKEEQRQIQSCKVQAMNAVGALSMFAVHINAARNKKFYEKLHDLYKTNFGWDRTYVLLEITPIHENVQKYKDLNVAPIMEELSMSIKKGVKAALESELKNANEQMMAEWENDIITQKFRIDEMMVGILTHILMEEV